MAEELTWPGLTAKVGSLGFSEEDQGYIRGRLLAMSSEMWARYLDGSDAMVRGQLLTLLPAGSGAGAGSVGSGGGVVPADTLTTNMFKDFLPQLANQVAAAVAERMYTMVEVPASDCASSQWDRVVPQLPSVVRLNLSCAAPCCQPECEPVHVPPHVWPSLKEDDDVNIVAAVQFLEQVLPPEIIPVPVQGIKWLSATFYLASIKLVITESKTDYLLVYKPAWDALTHDLGITLINSCKVSDTVKLRDHLPRLLPYILGFYEAKTPAFIQKQFKKARAQAILEHLAAWQMMDRQDAPVVLFGDFTRTYCVHSSGDFLDNLPGIHVAGPRLDILPEGQAVAQTISAQAQVWGMARALLEQAKAKVTTGLVASQRHAAGGGVGSGNHDVQSISGQQSGGVGSGSHDVQSTSGRQGGAWATTWSEVDRDVGHDAEMEEATRMNVHAQQLMSLMRQPEIYGSFGLECPPTTLELGSAEETWAQLKVLSVTEPSAFEAQGKQAQGSPARERAL